MQFKYTIRFALTVALLMVLSDTMAQILKAYYSFEINEQDITGYHSSAVLHNGATIEGGRAVLDGADDYLEIRSQLIPSSGDFTLMFRAKSTGPSNTYTNIISQNGSTAGTNFYVGQSENGNIRAGDDWEDTGYPFPTDGEWHHFTITKDTGDVILYLDGMEVAAKGSTMENPVPSGNAEFRIGRQYQDLGEYFQGEVEEVKIYREALDSSLIASIKDSYHSFRYVWDNYFLNPGEHDWYTSNDLAWYQDAQKASFFSLEEENEVHGLIGWDDYWLGIYQDPTFTEPTEGWKRQSGGDLTYTNWETGQPDNQDDKEDFVWKFQTQWRDDSAQSIHKGVFSRYADTLYMGSTYAFNKNLGNYNDDVTVGSFNGDAGFAADRCGEDSMAVSFKSNGDYVELPYSLGYLGGNTSLSFWIKTSQSGSNTASLAPGVTGIIDNVNDQSVYWGFISENGKISFGITDSLTVMSNTSINNDIWHHVVITRSTSDGTIQIYIDGKLDKVERLLQDHYWPVDFSSVGRMANSPVSFIGSLDAIKNYDHVIDADLVERLYNEPCNGTEGINDVPIGVSLSNLVVSENLPDSTVIGMFTTDDPDPGDTHTYDFDWPEGNENQFFQIVGNYLVANESFDYEAKTSYNIYIRSTDQDFASVVENFVIEIGNVDDTDPLFRRYSGPPNGVYEVSSYSSAEGQMSFELSVEDDESGLDSVNLFYTVIETGIEMEVEIPITNDTVLFFTYEFTDEQLDSNPNLEGVQLGGVSYYVRAVDKVGNVDTSMVWEVVANVSITLEEDAEDIGYDSPGRDVKNYKIVAFPFQRGSVNDLFDELGKYDDRKWRMVQYASGKYEDIDNDGIVDPGKGYFFISLEKVDLMVGGSSPEFPLGRLNKALENGFTLIGNPFLETLNWDEVIRFNVDQGTIEANEIRGLITYDNGKWGVANTLAKYEGAFVEANRVINLAIPYAAVSSSRMAEREAEPSVQSVTDEEWSINLFLKSNELKYHVGRFGIRKGALDNNDKYDMGMVPQLEDHLAIEFEGGRAWDYKPGGGYKSWEFSIPNNLKDDEFEMRWDSPETGDQLLMMYDATKHKLIDMRNYTVYRIKNDPKAMHQFLFGTREEIEKNFRSSNAVVFDLYPNPASERLHLSLYVPNDQSTELVIRNLEGKTLFKESIYLNKGTNTIDLNVKEIPEGFYLLQVPTESNQVVNKILVR